VKPGITTIDAPHEEDAFGDDQAIHMEKGLRENLPFLCHFRRQSFGLQDPKLSRMRKEYSLRATSGT